jgi:hypothetical protein
MTKKTIGKIFRCTLAIAAGFAGLALDENVAKGPSISTAQAVIGRPLTPMSYAGVARRTTRRAAYAGAAYGAGAAYAYAAPPVYAAPPPAYGGSCMQTTDAYGRIVTTC